MKRTLIALVSAVALFGITPLPAGASSSSCGDIVGLSGSYMPVDSGYQLSLDVQVAKACRNVILHVYTGNNDATGYGTARSTTIHVSMGPLTDATISLLVVTGRGFGAAVPAVDRLPDSGYLGPYTAPAEFFSATDPVGDAR